MKALRFTIIAAVALFGFTSQALETGPALVEAQYHTGYIPDGFDTNDHIQFVGEGMFSNSCYRPAGVSVSVNQETKKIVVAPNAYKYDGMCLQMVVPYNQVLDVCLLTAGTYKVVQGDTEKDLGNLKVRVATNSNPDDFLYAPISQAYVKSAEGKTTLTLTGEFTNSCMQMVQVLTHVQPRVIVVQPIAEKLEVQKDGQPCEDGVFSFETTQQIKDVKHGRYLLHVRSLNAKAVNNLVDIK